MGAGGGFDTEGAEIAEKNYRAQADNLTERIVGRGIKMRHHIGPWLHLPFDEFNSVIPASEVTLHKIQYRRPLCSLGDLRCCEK